MLGDPALAVRRLGPLALVEAAALLPDHEQVDVGQPAGRDRRVDRSELRSGADRADLAEEVEAAPDLVDPAASVCPGKDGPACGERVTAEQASGSVKPRGSEGSSPTGGASRRAISKPRSEATAESTSSAARTTSGPAPSPGRTPILTGPVCVLSTGWRPSIAALKRLMPPGSSTVEPDATR